MRSSRRYAPTNEPKIEWHVAAGYGDNLAEFLAKAGYIGREIAAGRFYKQPEKWCVWWRFCI